VKVATKEFYEKHHFVPCGIIAIKVSDYIT